MLGTVLVIFDKVTLSILKRPQPKILIMALLIVDELTVHLFKANSKFLGQLFRYFFEEEIWGKDRTIKGF